MTNLAKTLSTIPLVIGLAMGGSAMAANTYGTAKENTHTMALAAVSNPKDTLTKAKVEDMSGNSVGTVDEVMLNKEGKPVSLKVDVGSFLGIGGKDVAMNASTFKFDPNRKILITSMTKDQIKNLPEAKS